MNMKAKFEHTSPLVTGIPQNSSNTHIQNTPKRSTSISVSGRRDSVSLSDYCSDNEANDMENNESYKDSQYRHAIELIGKRCEALSADNEKLVQRLHYVKKISKRKEKDVALLKGRLDLYSDDWRTAQPETQFKSEQPSLIPSTNNVVIRKKYKKREKHISVADKQGVNKDGNQENGEHVTSGPPNKLKKSKEGKRKRSEKEKDPNAPKRPANPFFQFCQEQRSILMGELNSELMPGQPELSKQELTRQLANRWRSLDSDSKQIYINMYENSKQKYIEEMQCYRGGREAAHMAANGVL